MIIPINEEFRVQVNQHISEEWAGPVVITKGTVHDTSYSEGFISLTNGELTGYILYEICRNQCEILVLQSILENQGIGSALIKAVLNKAKQAYCETVWLITTNDNIHAIRYYQKFGFELAAVHINAIEESRKLKPTIPFFGNEKIPLKHEFEFQYKL